MVTLVNQLGSTSVAIISSCSHALKTFESIASQKSILMKYSLVLEKDDRKILESIVNFLREKAVRDMKPGKTRLFNSVLTNIEIIMYEFCLHCFDKEGVETVVFMLESMEMEKFVGEGENTIVEQFQQLVQDKSWILGSVGVDAELMKDWSMKFHSNLLILQPHISPNPDFKSYLLDKLTVNIDLKFLKEGNGGMTIELFIKESLCILLKLGFVCDASRP